MRVEYIENINKLKISLSGEMDMQSCRTKKEEVDSYIFKYSPKECSINLNEVTFMDSAGLGFIMGRYNVINMLGGKLILEGANPNMQKLISISNINKNIEIV